MKKGKVKLALSMALLCGALGFTSSALAVKQACTLSAVYVPYHESTGQTTYIYVYDC
jgi:hypothetical protein